MAVLGIQKRFQEYLKTNEIDYNLVSQKLGHNSRSIETIVFRLLVDDRTELDLWIGTIQWVCKSPIRKYSKRKNWFVKSCEITLPKLKSVNLNDVTIKTYKASGPGGQHRNKVETAVRIIHRQSGIIVTASNRKSKAQNKKAALEKLEAKLQEYNKKLQMDFNQEEWTNKLEVERGHPVKIFYGLKFLEV